MDLTASTMGPAARLLLVELLNSTKGRVPGPLKDVQGESWRVSLSGANEATRQNETADWDAGVSLSWSRIERATGQGELRPRALSCSAVIYPMTTQLIARSCQGVLAFHVL